MTETTELARATLAGLEAELVPLEVAAALTYLTTARHRIDDPERVPEMLHLAAVALAQMAPIRRRAEDADVVLSSADVEAILFAPIRERAAPAALEGYFVRRDELRKALVTMREARQAFEESSPVKLRTAAALLHYQLTGAARDSMKAADYYTALTRAAAQLAQVVDLYRPQGHKLVRLTDAEIAEGGFVDGGNVLKTSRALAIAASSRGAPRFSRRSRFY